MGLTAVATSFLFLLLTLVPPIAANPIAFPEPQAGDAVSYVASFTNYGIGDDNNSGNCTIGGACSYTWYGGYTAAVSTALYNNGAACGTCWNLQSELGGFIKVRIDNHCPGPTNPLCNQTPQQQTNSMGAPVHFDVCSDSGAKFFFGGKTLAQKGTATKTTC